MASARARSAPRMVFVLLLSALAGASRGDELEFMLRSTSFDEGGEIPSRHTCEGEDISPPLSWTDPPPGTRSLALIVDDPDAPDPAAPKMTWVHWVVLGIPATVRELPEGAGGGRLPAGARSGKNDWKREAWGGPCPPIGRHRYYFKLYALDAVPENLKAPTAAALQGAMEGHVLAQAQLMGTYVKKR